MRGSSNAGLVAQERETVLVSDGYRTSQRKLTSTIVEAFDQE